MRHSLAKQVEASPALGPVVRRGLEGGCIACRRPISDHVDARGQWIGCRAVSLPENCPFLLIPDRRLQGTRRVTAAPGIPDRRRAVLDPEPGQPIRATNRRASDPPPAAVANEPVRTQTRRRVSGAHVTYVGRAAMSTPAVQKLPPSDRRVYALVRAARTVGLTRRQLLSALRAGEHTGRVDGAVRRLRLRRLVSVRPVAPDRE